MILEFSILGKTIPEVSFIWCIKVGLELSVLLLLKKSYQLKHCLKIHG